MPKFGWIGKREIYRVMEELLEQDVGILTLTSDYTAALGMSNRIIVLRRGSIRKKYQREEPMKRTFRAKSSAR